MICFRCGATNEHTAQFCAVCRQELPRWDCAPSAGLGSRANAAPTVPANVDVALCRFCGVRGSLDANFCMACGGPRALTYDPTTPSQMTPPAAADEGPARPVPRASAPAGTIDYKSWTKWLAPTLIAIVALVAAGFILDDGITGSPDAGGYYYVVCEHGNKFVTTVDSEAAAIAEASPLSAPYSNGATPLDYVVALGTMRVIPDGTEIQVIEENETWCKVKIVTGERAGQLAYLVTKEQEYRRAEDP